MYESLYWMRQAGPQPQDECKTKDNNATGQAVISVLFIFSEFVKKIDEKEHHKSDKKN